MSQREQFLPEQTKNGDPNLGAPGKIKRDCGCRIEWIRVVLVQPADDRHGDAGRLHSDDGSIDDPVDAHPCHNRPNAGFAEYVCKSKAVCNPPIGEIIGTGAAPGKEDKHPSGVTEIAEGINDPEDDPPLLIGKFGQSITRICGEIKKQEFCSIALRVTEHIRAILSQKARAKIGLIELRIGLPVRESSIAEDQSLPTTWWCLRIVG